MLPAGKRRRTQQKGAAAGVPRVQKQLRVLLPATSQSAGMLPNAYVHGLPGTPYVRTLKADMRKHEHTCTPVLSVTGIGWDRTLSESWCRLEVAWDQSNFQAWRACFTAVLMLLSMPTDGVDISSQISLTLLRMVPQQRTPIGVFFRDMHFNAAPGILQRCSCSSLSCEDEGYVTRSRPGDMKGSWSLQTWRVSVTAHLLRMTPPGRQAVSRSGRRGAKRACALLFFTMPPSLCWSSCILWL